MNSFDIGYRARFFWTMKSDQAYLLFHRGTYQKAIEIWESILPKYVSDRWSVLEAGILEMLVQCYLKVIPNQYTGFCRVASGLLASPVCPPERRVQLTKDLEKASRNMERTLHCRDWPCLRIRVLNLLNKVGDDEGIIADCVVTSLLETVCLNLGFELTAGRHLRSTVYRYACKAS